MYEIPSAICDGLGNVASRLWLNGTNVSKMQGYVKDVVGNVMPLGTLLEKVSLVLWVTLMLIGVSCGETAG